MNSQNRALFKINTLLLVVATFLGVSFGQGAPLYAAPQSVPAGAPRAATVTVDLWAKSGTLSLPGSVTVPIWGYASSAAGAAQIPGPTIIVNQGDTVQVTLHNNLLETTSLQFGGQALRPDLTGVSSGGAFTYSFVADNPGAYLYQAGPRPNVNAQYQVAMGLFGALIVRPTTPNQAYNDAATAYDDEAVLVLSEIDPLLNAAPATFDLRNYTPRYWLINGKVYPNTDPITTSANRKVLLRYLNAGLHHHSMTLLGADQRVIAIDGSPLPYAHTLVADTLAPGQTADRIATIPATAAAGARFALYDGNPFTLNNNAAAGFGGMLTFLTVTGGGPGGDTTGPAASAVTINPSTGLLTAQISDATTGNANIAAAEYRLDSTAAAPVAMSATDSAFDSPTENVQATIPPASLAGNHTIYVRGQDAIGNWGPFNLVTVQVDNVGPTSSALTLSPNPSNGSVDVILSATGNDSATGNSTIQAAEYTLDGGAAIPMSVNTVGPIADLTAVISAAAVNALTQGQHVITVRSQDAAGNWGAVATRNLLVDKTGPATTSVSATPNPNNGATGLSPTQPVVRVDATFNDASVGSAAIALETSAESAPGAPVDATLVNQVYMPLIVAGATNTVEQMVDAAFVLPDSSYVKTAEGFIDAVGANGTGFPFTPSDGLFDEGAEDGYVFIPLTTINTLSDGSHTLYVHAQDGAGNWGPTNNVILVIDRVPPTFSSITLAPNPTGGALNVTLTVNGSNGTGTSVVGGEYWFGTTDPVVGGGTAFTGLTANIPAGSLAVGTYTVRARIRDAANNWSATIQSATLTVTPPPFYFSTFGNTNPPSVGGTADDADIYFFNGATFSRAWDASTNGVLGAANVDGLVRLSANQHYLSFAGDTTITGLGAVQDEDIVYFNAGVWSVQFDGTAFGLNTSGNLDIDAFDYVGATLYLSTAGNTNPPGAGGGADDADIYRWNGGSSYTRIFDASTAGLPGGANVDGLTMIDATHFYLSFNGDITITGLGAVQDEDVVYYNAGVWSLRVDGTGLGLTGGDRDLDAIDIP